MMLCRSRILSRYVPLALVAISFLALYEFFWLTNTSPTASRHAEIKKLRERINSLNVELTQCQKMTRHCNQETGNEIGIESINLEIVCFLNGFPNVLFEQLDLLTNSGTFQHLAITFRPEYEIQRRRMSSMIIEMKEFAVAELENAQKTHGLNLDPLIHAVNERFKRIIALSRNLSEVDGMKLARMKEALRVKYSIESRFTRNQLSQENYAIGCDLTKACGFGCQIHHLLYCTIFAYFTQRRFVLDSRRWSYGKGAFTDLFQKLPNTDDKREQLFRGFVSWRGDLSSRAIHLPIIDIIRPRPDFLPLALPSHLVKETEILALHGQPFILFAGHLARQILKPQPAIRRRIDSVKKEHGFGTAIVGVHIRRTDKIGTEAQFHSIDEYMAHVKEYFDIEDIRLDTKLTRKVFVASDDPSVFSELLKSYPGYTFIYNTSSAVSGAVSSRYSKTSAAHVSIDILLLSECDFLVCTFSSQVCRVAYELMQTRFDDASWRFRSLDDIYYFGGQSAHKWIAVEDNVTPDKGLNFQKGDLIGIAGNHWNGYCIGENARTRQKGLFPCYKAIDHIVVAD